MFLPHGTRIFNKIVNYLRSQYLKYGFDEVITPTIYKKSLWEKSGHWENYKDDMYEVKGRGASGIKEGVQIGEDEQYGLKPMNCPGHCLMFQAQNVSYRELPVRYADFSPLHRNEVSGALSGLTRVRKFHQDDGHIFCRASQIQTEIVYTLQFLKEVLKKFNLANYDLVLSTRPMEEYIGMIEEWDRAEEALRTALDKNREPWSVSEGDGAFYGPKIDVILKDPSGKRHQTGTIQLDFQLPQRFGLQYEIPILDPETGRLLHHEVARPVLIHRALIGSIERFLALLIENYDGRWPLWLAPRPLIFIPVNNSPSVLDLINSTISTKKLQESFEGQVKIDSSQRSLPKRISDAKISHYAIIAIVGDREAKRGTFSIDVTGLSADEQKAAREWLWDRQEKAALESEQLVKPCYTRQDWRSIEVTADELAGLLGHLGH